MNKKIKTDAVDHLFDAILTLKNPEECYKFFEDVCTINELLSLSQRYEVAKMLRGVHGNHQPREPFAELWKRWVRYGVFKASGRQHCSGKGRRQIMKLDAGDCGLSCNRQ